MPKRNLKELEEMYIPVKWLLKNIAKNDHLKRGIYDDDEINVKLNSLGFACEEVLVNYLWQLDEEERGKND